MSKAIKDFSPEEYVKRIMEEKSLKKAVDVIMEFGEVYRKAYAAAKTRKYLSVPQNRERFHESYKKYWGANREQLNSKRRKGTPKTGRPPKKLPPIQ